MPDYVAHLSKDKKMAKLLQNAKPFLLHRKENIMLSLCGSIMSQQLSTKVAAVIHDRFLKLFVPDQPTEQKILALPPERLRAIGLSNAKVQYVRNVARFALEEGISNEIFDEMENEQVIEYLTRIKGVGRWTVEMLLMFTLAREDVFACDDLGIQNAMIKIYKLDKKDKKQFRQKLLKISGKWSPYRSFACMHLWHWKDNTPILKTSGK